jgi:hypothetical protein
LHNQTPEDRIVAVYRELLDLRDNPGPEDYYCGVGPAADILAPAVAEILAAKPEAEPVFFLVNMATGVTSKAPELQATANGAPAGVCNAAARQLASAAYGAANYCSCGKLPKLVIDAEKSPEVLARVRAADHSIAQLRTNQAFLDKALVLLCYKS